MRTSTYTLVGKHMERFGLSAGVLLCVALSSCSTVAPTRAPIASQGRSASYHEIADAGHALASDQASRAIEKVPHQQVEEVCYEGLPLPIACPQSPWSPPGIQGPWPADEYLEDGGDRDIQVNLGAQGQIRGLELEDTVAVYDSIDGRTCVEPSNRVCLYAPRFAAVRKVESVSQGLQNDQPIGVAGPEQPHLHQEDRLAIAAAQPVRPIGSIATRAARIERVGEGVLRAVSRQPIAAINGGFAMYENLLVVRRGVFEESEKARLVDGVDAALVWSLDLPPQVMLDGRAAVAVTGDQTAQLTYRIDEPDHPCLRVIKVASTKTARPGDIVDFTIRFDNLGDQTIKRVVLVDNLTTRLEYVPGSAQSSRPAEFSTEVNQGESLLLRWEFADPLPVGAGGLVRFHCRVR